MSGSTGGVNRDAVVKSGSSTLNTAQAVASRILTVQLQEQVEKVRELQKGV